LAPFKQAADVFLHEQCVGDAPANFSATGSGLHEIRDWIRRLETTHATQLAIRWLPDKL